MAQASLIKWLYFSGAHDSTGAPVSSGSAYFYVPHSTSSQIIVYSDDAASVPISQPVALDAAGRAQVFITENCEIKVLDAAGASVRLVVSAESVMAHLVYCTYASSQTTLDVALATIENALTGVAPAVVVDTLNLETISTASPSFTFDATKPLNVFKATYGGAMGTLTVNGASVAAYSRYRIVIQTGNSSTAAATTLPATWKTVSPPTTLAAATCYSADFEVATSGAVVQITPWTVVAGLWW